VAIGGHEDVGSKTRAVLFGSCLYRVTTAIFRYGFSREERWSQIA
jgi:hypothetical protein